MNTDILAVLGRVPDANARHMLLKIWDVIQILDDLIDKDVDIDDDAICRAFLALVELPLNPFYDAHRGVFIVLLQSIYMRWRAANVYERERRSLEKAYMLRAGYYDLIAMTLYLLNGHQDMDAMCCGVWDMYGETLDGLRREVQGNA